MAGDFCEIGSIPLPNATWFIDAVAVFQQSYGQVHPFVATMLCAVGTFMNLATVIVLTRPSMVSPVNVLLCAVAICDILVMTSNLVFVVHFHFVAEGRCEVRDFSYGWALFTIFHAHISVIFHATSIWLTVSLAQIRVLTIRRATSGPTTNISERFSIILSIVTLIVMVCVNLPNFMTFEVDEVPAEAYLSCLQTESDGADDSLLPLTNGSWVYAVRAHEKDCMKLKMAFWSNGMIFKVVPCLLLTVSIVALLKIIADVSNKRKNLAQVMKKKVPKDHTTPMLVAVLSIFLLAELPQGILLVMSGIFSSEVFKKKIYLPLGDFMDFLSLLNSAIGFLIYVAMSRKFRSVFFQLFFSLLHCSPYYYDSEWSNGEPELSETLQLLDAQLAEGGKKPPPPQSLLARLHGFGLDCAFTFCHCCCSARARRVRRQQRKLSMHHSQYGRRTPQSAAQRRRASCRQKSIPLIVAAATGTSITELTRKSVSNVFNSAVAPPSIVGPSAFFAKPQRSRATATRTMSLAPIGVRSPPRSPTVGSPPPRSHRHSFGSNSVRPLQSGKRQSLAPIAASPRRLSPAALVPPAVDVAESAPPNFSFVSYTRRERKLRCHLPSARKVQRALHASKRVSRRRSDGDQAFVAALRERRERCDPNNNEPRQPTAADARAGGDRWGAAFLRLVRFFGIGRRTPAPAHPITSKPAVPRLTLQDPTVINERSDEEDEDASSTGRGANRRFRHSTDGLVGGRGEVSRLCAGHPPRPFDAARPANAPRPLFLDADALEHERRRWSRITSGSVSYGTDPCGVASFAMGGGMSGLFGGEIEGEASTFSDYYERFLGRRNSRFTATTTAIEMDGPSRMEQKISVILPASSEQPAGGRAQRPQPIAAANLLSVPMGAADGKRLSLFSNATTNDPTSTQCSHAPLVIVPPARRGRPAAHATRQNTQHAHWNETVQRGIRRLGGWWSGGDRRVAAASRPWTSRPLASAWRSVRDRLAGWSTSGGANGTPQTPRTRVGQLRAETSYSGFVY
ncbi:Cholecystokinin receptor [Aphelenchoides fujianensis]|nr:Cholecystokinin receptor [Aphelenchoides fujianensis]